MSDFFCDEDLDLCDTCPWCGSSESESWGGAIQGIGSKRCLSCDVVFVEKRLTAAGQERFYASYLTREHDADAELSRARSQMYEVEYRVIAPHVASGRVLDVGCSRGGFLEVFAANGFDCHGVELGAEAANHAGQQFPIWQGEFPELAIDDEFDLVIFRGVIEHCLDPKAYLEKAWSLLPSGGVLYLTSTPNRDSLCCDLYRELWNQHGPAGHLFHLAVRHLDQFFEPLGCTKLFERYLYEETPYANPERDVMKVSDALARRARGEAITEASPAFWGNMLSVAYRKN